MLIQQLYKALQSADAVVVGAGSGLSTSAGFTYSGERFQKYFADFIEKYGFSDMYSAGFYHFPTEEEKWAYWRSDETFVEDDGWHAASERYVDFIKRHMNVETHGRASLPNGKILFLDLGSGGNAPEDKQDERNTSANHWKVIERHGFKPLFKVDIMDEEGEMRIPVADTTHLKYDIVGSHMANYDFMIALNHFKGHPMGGYGGALKNLSIGCASSNGKAYIHSAGKMEVLDMAKLWTPEYIDDQDGFLESMAAAAQAVVNHFQQKKGIIYISVMNNMSIDCDCVDHPEPVRLKDYGILASTDPVALDQACVDIINQQKVTAENDPTDLIGRINKQHGVHTIEWAEKIGLGSRKYHMVDIDRK